MIVYNTNDDIDEVASFYDTSEFTQQDAVSNKIIVTLVTQGLPSSFLSRPVA